MRRRAAVLAMRDAAALIILQMDKATGISKLRRPGTASDSGELNAGPATGTPAPLQTTAQEDTTDETG